MDTAVRLFASEIPMYYARGNHETRGVFATEIQRYFSPCQEHLYYAFRQGPVYCIVLDTEKISLILILNMPVLPNMSSTVPNSPNGWPVF